MIAIESINVSMFRQYSFCPRIPYYEFFLDLKVRKPEWTHLGNRWEEIFKKKFDRRTLNRFGLQQDAQKLFYLHLHSEKLNIHGIVDCLLLTDDLVLPIEFKKSRFHISTGHKLQLYAYGLMAAEIYQKKFEKGYLIYGEQANNYYCLKVSPSLQENFSKAQQNIQSMYEKAVKPSSSASIAQCQQCEYLLHCNDRDTD